MRFVYLLLVLLLVLCNVSCKHSSSHLSANEKISQEDSLKIVTAFAPPFDQADSVFLSLYKVMENKRSAQHLLKASYAKTLIMTGQLAKADSVVSQSLGELGIDSLSLSFARFANLKAALLAYQQNQEAAINYYKQALQIFENHDDVRNTASVSFNIANIFLSQLDYPMAYQYSGIAVKDFQSIQDTLYYPSALAVNAVATIALEKRDEAYKKAKEAEKISLQYKNPLGITMSDYALGDIAMYDEDYDAAIMHYQKIIPMSQQLQQVPIVAAAYASLLKALLENKEWSQVIEEGNKALEFTEKHHYEDVSYALHRHISQAYQQKGDEHNALVFLRKADDFFRDEVVSNNRRTMGELLVKYETEKKDKLLAQQQLLIQQKNTSIKIWLLIGVVLLIIGLVYLYLVKKHQAQKLKLLRQENENAVLNALMNGEEKERNRISRELHDGVAAMIGATQMSLQSLPYISDEKKQEQIDKLANLVSKTHAEVRRVAHDLLPLTLENEGLVPAIQQFSGELNAVGALQIQVQNDLPDEYSISKRTELMLYRMVQELINNVMKHAQATQAWIQLSANKQELKIEVIDNGVGFSNAQENQGLKSIRERLKVINGAIQITSAKPNGTRVVIRLQ
ncbi:MAG: histidine kinase [Crocinitomicaceae bacterium]